MKDGQKSEEKQGERKKEAGRKEESEKEREREEDESNFRVGSFPRKKENPEKVETTI